jgi:adenosylhomocysteine nucleosidase
MSRVAIVAALEREVRSLVKEWQVSEKESEGRRYRFFEKDDLVVVCGGIGPAAARRAAEAMIALYTPSVIYSAGFAGALDAGLKVADILRPLRLVNASDGSSLALDHGQGVLVSFGSIASPAQKASLRDSFGAQAVDMEAGAVARAAEARGVGFAVVKVISDEFDFDFPSMERFVDPDGRFLEGRFARFAALRPWLWPRVAKLARNSRRASRALCDRLRKLPTESMSTGSSVPTMEAVDHP